MPLAYLRGIQVEYTELYTRSDGGQLPINESVEAEADEETVPLATKGSV